MGLAYLRRLAYFGTYDLPFAGFVLFNCSEERGALCIL